jgi:general secretion pathway protein M
MDALKQFWIERAPRERLVLGIGGVMLAAVLLYLMLIEPAWTGIGRLERSLPQQRAQAAELDALLGEVKGLRTQPQVATVSPSEVKGAIESSLGRAGLKMARMIPLSEGDLQLTFSNVPYGAWASWLSGIERELGARATTVVVTGKEGAPGNVDAELALRLARK